ncbi:MAG: branched-chain amino acid ABC transporter ATP-binding protein/permease [Acidimicrobiia bacterium]|nr:branched-chain amino acid ABC transporter ATP-binding protein/permease [Acidimicrobiia bacterium]
MAATSTDTTPEPEDTKAAEGRRRPLVEPSEFLLHRRWPLGLVLVAACASYALFTRDNPYYLRLGIQYGCIYAVVLARLNVLTGANGQVSQGLIAFVTIGAYTAGWAGVAGMPWILTALIAVFFALVGGVLIGAPSLRLRGAYLALATLAFALIVLELLEAMPRVLGVPGGSAVVLDVPRPVIGPLALGSNRGYFLFTLAIAVPVVALSRNFFWSQTGRQLVAIRDDEAAAASIGIAVFPAKLGAFLFSAGCAGLGGAMFAAFNEAVFPEDFTVVESLRYVVALIIGGLAAPVAGPVLGAAAMILLVYVGQRWFQDDQALLTGLVFLGFLAFAPMGVGGLLRRGAEAVGLAWIYPGNTLVAVAARRKMGPEGDLGSLRPSDAGADSRAVVRFGTEMTGHGHLQSIDHPAGPVLAEEPPLLECVGVSKAYGGVRAVDDLSFDLREGSIHVLMGPNGSGKSTALDVISGLVPPDSGRVHLAGRDITDLPAHARARLGIGRTFQEIRLFHSLTALENCMVANASQRRTLVQLARLPRARREDEAHAEDALTILEAWGLGEFADRPAGALSYGQRKMLELARAASRHPSLLLVDEPAAGLNPRWVGAMVDALSALRDAGFTLLVVEHHQDVIADLADTVTVLDQGRKIAEGPPQHVQRLPEVIEVYLGAPEVSP